MIGIEHGLTCECGQTFQNLEELQRHITIEKTLEEIKRIGGEKFWAVAREWEEDTHSGDLRELAETHKLELTPGNATEIAKKEIIHIVQHYDNYEIDDHIHVQETKEEEVQ